MTQIPSGSQSSLPRLEQMLLESAKGRFRYVQMVKDWVKVLQHSEEGKGLTSAELIQLALEDITTGEVTADEVAEKIKKVKHLPPPVNDEFAMPQHSFDAPEQSKKHAKGE